MGDSPKNSGGGYGFGTFGGVFTPSILTIFGLIMFMRANFVVGNAGLVQTAIILSLCSGITLLTAFSISAISTNTAVGGGGAYFLISRVLGPGFGTAIGIALFVAQALSVPFYILGFVEALATVWPGLPFRLVCLATLAVLFVVTWVGADVAIRFQYIILAVLVVSIFVFMIGLAQHFEADTMRSNIASNYADNANMWTMFAVYFPAVTGIMAGVNMSGDLRDPAKSIPRGILAAIILSFFVYGIQIVLASGLTDAETLREQPFQLLMDHAWLGLSWLVIAGVFSATLSSAIGSYLGAPRVLQAVARDKTVAVLAPFSAGQGKQDEPRRALIATFVIGAVTLIAVGGDSGGGGLNLVAAMVTMVFLYTYGMTNLAAFVESFGKNPSFRPRFRFFHWSSALVGGVACVWSAMMINALAAALALAVLAVLFVLARVRENEATYGDARRGFVYQRARSQLLNLSRMPPHPKNWRPTSIVFSGNPYARLALVRFARWFGMNCGIVSVVSVVVGDTEKDLEKCDEARRQLQAFVEENKLDVFPETVMLEDFDRDLKVFLQSYSIGPIKPNMVLFGWPRDEGRLGPFFSHLRTTRKLGKSSVIVMDRMGETRLKRVDCWWRGQGNGPLMVTLCHLLLECEAWRGAKLRLIRQIQSEEEAGEALRELQQVAGQARIDAEFATPIGSGTFQELLHRESADADLVVLGFVPAEPGQEVEAYKRLTALFAPLSSVILVNSSGEVDLEA
ncbi:MAG TPA: amino acid permease [Lentisphaeria bacterium]|nr:amino acid permease [Lentisphaeria bacterium]